METMASWFGLKDEHENFFIANDKDARLLLARTELDEQIQQMLRRAFRTNNPPKLVLYGDWGVGKTHTMRHIELVIDNEPDFKGLVVFSELPDINAKSTFQVAHAALLDALGQTTVRNWIIQYQARFPADAMDTIQRTTQSEDIAKAFMNLLSHGDAARIAWDWLRGLSLSATDARSAGLPPVLGQSAQLVWVLRMLGRICKEIEGALLIFMLDEATKLSDVSNGDAIHHWLNCFKIISDKLTNEIGFIISASFRHPDDMPEPLQNQQVMSRFGERNYIQLHNFQVDQSREFTQALLLEWINPSKRAALLQSHPLESDGEAVSDDTFPFTEQGVDLFVEYACQNGGFTTPRDLQEHLDAILNRAIDENRHILSSSFMHHLLAGN